MTSCMEADFKVSVTVYDRNTDCTKAHEIYFKAKPAEINVGSETYKLTAVDIIQSGVIAIRDYFHEYNISCVMSDVFDKHLDNHAKGVLIPDVHQIERIDTMYEKNKITSIKFDLIQRYYGFHEAFEITSNTCKNANKESKESMNNAAEPNISSKDNVEKMFSSLISKDAYNCALNNGTLTSAKELQKKVKTTKKLPEIKSNKRLYQVSLHNRDAIEFLTADKWISEGFYFSDDSDEKAKLHAEACLLNNIRNIISKDLVLFDIKIAPSKNEVCQIGTIFLKDLESKYCIWDVSYIGKLCDAENECGD